MTMFCFFDVETNGRRMMAKGLHRIVQLAYVAVQGDEVVTFDHFVKQEDIDPGITGLTGITRNDIWKYGLDEYEVALHLQQLLSLRPVMVAHNCQFDLHMVFDLLQRQLGNQTAYELVSDCQWIDTLTIALDRWSIQEHPHKLENCITHYQCENVVNNHNAFEDVMALYSVFAAMVQERPDVDKYANIFGYPDWIIDHVGEFDFITYKPQSNKSGFVNSDEILPYIGGE